MCTPAILALTRRYHRIFSGTIIKVQDTDSAKVSGIKCSTSCKVQDRMIRKRSDDSVQINVSKMGRRDLIILVCKQRQASCRRQQHANLGDWTMATPRARIMRVSRQLPLLHTSEEPRSRAIICAISWEYEGEFLITLEVLPSWIVEHGHWNTTLRT